MTTVSTAKPENNSQPGTAKRAGAKPAANPFMLPPEEQFWKRYSPHYEMPISGLTSFLFHGVVLGLFLGLGILAAMMGWNRSHDIQFEAVRMPGGGGGNPDGSGDAPGVGTGPLVEDTQGKQATEQQADVTPLPDRPPLDAKQVEIAKEVFPDDVTVRYINSGNENIDKMMKSLNKDVLNKLRDGLTPGKGESGTGSGGGNGTGKGTGDGPGIGNGKGQLSDREKRMLRWVMVFETQNPRDYINQLAGLGAILAIPSGREGQYVTIRDLHKRPATPQAEDVAALNRIYWVDDKPHRVLAELGVRQQASHFVAFMPQELEAKLFEKELAYKNLREDQIFETKFKVIRRGGGYDVEVTEQTAK